MSLVCVNDDQPCSFMTTPLRIVLYASDIVAMLGCSDASAYRLIRKIKKAKGKPIDTHISVADFCEFTYLKYEEVMFSLNRGKAQLDVTIIRRDDLRAVSVK
jgi:hypothetical protein